MENPVYKYYKKQEKQVLDNMDLYFKDKEDIEAIHNLRLSLKRLKVLLYQMEYLSEGQYKAKEPLNYINGLFKKAGNLRDVQVQQKVLNNYCKELNIGCESYLQYLNNLEDRYKPIYEKSLNSFDRNFLTGLDQQIQDILKDISEDVIHYKAAVLMNDKLKSVKAIYYKSKKEKRFHKIRRHLKDINYLNNIMEGKLPVASAMHIDEDRLKELGSLLGEWHDKVNALIFLDRFMKQNKNPGTEEADSLTILFKHISLEKKKEYQQLNKAFKKEMKI